MLNWLREVHKYGQPSDIGKLGKWKIFSISWRTRSRVDDTNPYALLCSLPGLKSDLGVFDSVEVAKQKAETVLIYWLKEAGL